MLEGEWGIKGSALKGFEESVESASPEAYDDDVLCRNIAKKYGDRW